MQSFCKGSIGDLNKLDEFVGQEFRVAGIITDAQHRNTKNGAPFGSFDVEDYSDTCKLFVFSDSYLKFKHHLSTGNFVFITGKVQPRKFGDGLEFKINSIELLAEVREKRTRALVLSAEYADITDQGIDELYTIMLAHHGTCQVKFLVKDHKTNTTLRMPSRSLKIMPDQEFIRKIDAMRIFECKLE